MKLNHWWWSRLWKLDYEYWTHPCKVPSQSSVFYLDPWICVPLKALVLIKFWSFWKLSGFESYFLPCRLKTSASQGLETIPMTPFLSFPWDLFIEGPKFLDSSLSRFFFLLEFSGCSIQVLRKGGFPWIFSSPYLWYYPKVLNATSSQPFLPFEMVIPKNTMQIFWVFLFFIVFPTLSIGTPSHWVKGVL